LQAFVVYFPPLVLLALVAIYTLLVGTFIIMTKPSARFGAAGPVDTAAHQPGRDA